MGNYGVIASGYMSQYYCTAQIYYYIDSCINATLNSVQQTLICFVYTTVLWVIYNSNTWVDIRVVSTTLNIRMLSIAWWHIQNEKQGGSLCD